MMTTFQRMLSIYLTDLLICRFDDGRLPLVAADRRLRDFNPQLVGDLQLHGLLAEPRHLAVDAAGRDHPVADLQRLEKLLHLLLLPLHRPQDDEVEDADDEDDWNGRRPQAGAFGRRAEGQERADEHDHDWDARWWNSSLKLSNRPNAIASLILRRVS